MPPEFKSRFMAARAKALEDPKVQAARAHYQEAKKEYHAALRRAIIESDPALRAVSGGFAQ